MLLTWIPLGLCQEPQAPKNNIDAKQILLWDWNRTCNAKVRFLSPRQSFQCAGFLPRWEQCFFQQTKCCAHNSLSFISSLCLWSWNSFLSFCFSSVFLSLRALKSHRSLLVLVSVSRIRRKPYLQALLMLSVLGTQLPEKSQWVCSLHSSCLRGIWSSWEFWSSFLGVSSQASKISCHFYSLVCVRALVCVTHGGFYL